MLKTFDVDALLAALPRRSVRPLPAGVVVRRVAARPAVEASALGEKGQYNGFSGRERDRTANLSKWLAQQGCVERPPLCNICSAPADDEHAENYYDLASWIGLCSGCHRTLLHGRFTRPARWRELLDKHEVPASHWANLVSDEPFDLAGLLRQRGIREPVKLDFQTHGEP